MGTRRKIRNYAELLLHMTCTLPKYSEHLQVIKVSDTETVIIYEDDIHESIKNPNSVFKQYRKQAIENGTINYNLPVFCRVKNTDGIKQKTGRKLGTKDSKPRKTHVMTTETKLAMRAGYEKYYKNLKEAIKPNEI